MKKKILHIVIQYILKNNLIDFVDIRKYILKNYSDGIETVLGTGKEEGNIIAYAWRFYDEEYEKRRCK